MITYVYLYIALWMYYGSTSMHACFVVFLALGHCQRDVAELLDCSVVRCMHWRGRAERCAAWRGAAARAPLTVERFQIRND